MTDGDRLLRAVLEDPDDDGPRLVLADWLDEHGLPERAAKLREWLARPDATLLIGWHNGGWMREPFRSTGGPVPVFRIDERWWWAFNGLPRQGGVEADMRRGFVESVALPTQTFLDHAAVLFAAAPVTAVRLTDREPAQAYGGWCWFAQGDRYPDPDVTPRELTPHLFGPGGVSGSMFRCLDRDAALAVLSAACVAFGRAAADLPELAAAGRVP